MRPYAGTASSSARPATGCVGPADHYLGLLAGTMGDLALAEVHHEAGTATRPPHGFPALRRRGRSGAGPHPAQRRRPGDEERVAVLLRSAEESALGLGLLRLARWPRPGLTDRSAGRGALLRGLHGSDASPSS